MGERNVSRILSRVVINLGGVSPHPSSGLPGGIGGATQPPARPCSRWGLPSHQVALVLVGSYPTVPPLPCPGGLLLYGPVRGSPLPGVTRHPAPESGLSSGRTCVCARDHLLLSPVLIDSSTSRKGSNEEGQQQDDTTKRLCERHPLRQNDRGEQQGEHRLDHENERGGVVSNTFLVLCL